VPLAGLTNSSDAQESSFNMFESLPATKVNAFGSYTELHILLVVHFLIVHNNKVKEVW
jgi:hypothetical protein